MLLALLAACVLAVDARSFSRDDPFCTNSSAIELQALNSQNLVDKRCAYYMQCGAKVTDCSKAPPDQYYVKNYGDKYCRRFAAEQFKTDTAKLWRDATLPCLQTSLVTFFKANPKPTCIQIADAAFNSHPPCYTQQGKFANGVVKKSICDMMQADKAALKEVWQVAMTVDPADLATARSAKQMAQVAVICVKQIGARGVQVVSDALKELGVSSEAVWNEIKNDSADLYNAAKSWIGGKVDAALGAAKTAVAGAGGVVGGAVDKAKKFLGIKFRSINRRKLNRKRRATAA